jgi:hypothetical protein
MSDRKDQDPAEGSRETIDKELARQEEGKPVRPGEKGAGNPPKPGEKKP